LPIICIWYFLYKGDFKQQSQINVVWADDAFIKNWSKSPEKTFSFNTFRTFDNIALTGNQNENDLILKNLRGKIKRLGIEKDTINGYSIQFTKYTQYENVIKVLDMGMQNDFKNISFAPYNDKVFICWTKSEISVSRSKIDDGGIEYTPEKTKWEQFQIKMRDFKGLITINLKSLIPFWPSGILLIMMFWFWNKKDKSFNPSI